MTPLCPFCKTQERIAESERAINDNLLRIVEAMLPTLDSQQAVVLNLRKYFEEMLTARRRETVQ